MKKLLDKMLLPQDKANHFVWTVIILNVILGLIVFVDWAFGLNIHFAWIMGVAFMATALIGLFKEMRDFTSGKGTPSFMDTLANLYGLLTAYGLIALAIIAYK